MAPRARAQQRSRTMEHVYRPRGACRALLRCREAEVLVAGPAGTGKSRACLEKLHAMCLLTPGMRGLICRKSATSLSSTALVTWRKFVAHESLLHGDMVYYGGSAEEPPQYRYANGSAVYIGGLDKVSKIMSAEYDVIYVQEATELTEDDWEALTTRLRNWQVSFQQLMADCNPQNPEHWLKVRTDQGKTTMLVSLHEDNPQLFRPDGTITERGKDYLGKLDRLTGVRYQRLRLGKWVAAEGVVFEDYLSTVHIYDTLPAFREATCPSGIPLSWRRYWAVDFGFTNPFVLQWWAEDPDGRLYMYREIYQTKRTVDQHAALALSLVRDERGMWREPKPTAIVCDHDAEGRAVLERELGISTTPAHKSVLEGIECVQVRMRVAGDGRPRIFLARDALVRRDPELEDAKKPTCTIEEIPAYIWSDKTKEAPVKEDDHGCDSMRYMCAERDFGIRAIYRSFTT